MLEFCLQAKVAIYFSHKILVTSVSCAYNYNHLASQNLELLFRENVCRVNMSDSGTACERSRVTVKVNPFLTHPVVATGWLNTRPYVAGRSDRTIPISFQKYLLST